MKIASLRVTSLLQRIISSRMHSLAALIHLLFDQQLASMKRDLERGMRSFSISRVVLFSLLVAMLSALPFSGCVRRTRNAPSPSASRTQAVAPTPDSQPNASEQESVITTGNDSAAPASRVNINTASVKELEKLPGIGKGLAERIVEHREKYGPFRRPEHLIMVGRISDKRFRALRDLITVE